MLGLNKRKLLLLCLLATLIAFIGVAVIRHGSAKNPVAETIHQTFEDNDGGWIPFGRDAQVELTRDLANVKKGNSALALHYRFNPGQYGSAILPIERGQVSKLSKIRFWIKADHATSIIVILSEKQPGGYYSSWFWSEKDRWQQVELEPADFALDQGPGDPEDPDERLDLDQIVGIGISDLGQAFQTLGADSTYPLIVDKGFGNHSLYVDDFDLIISTKGESKRVDYRSIGSLNRGFLTWITLGGVELEINSSDNPLGEPAVVASYEQVQGRYTAISHSLSNLDLRGTKKLTFRIAAKNDSKIMVYLEKKSPGAIAGPRYSYLLSVPGGSRPAQQQIALADLRPDVSGPRDVDERLNPGELKSISFIDITGAVSPPPKKNTVWISSIQPQ